MVISVAGVPSDSPLTTLALQGLWPSAILGATRCPVCSVGGWPQDCQHPDAAARAKPEEQTDTTQIPFLLPPTR